jgi:flagellar hook-associated protein 1 FlgK
MSSLFGIISNATQSLFNVQTQIGVVADNIGNANSPNFTARQATTIEQNPETGGTDVVAITRAVNNTLQQEVLAQSNDAAKKTSVDQLYTQLEQLDGSASGTPSLSGALQQFVNAFKAFQATPEDTAVQGNVVQTATNFVNTIQTVATGVEQISAQTTKQVQSDVTTLNNSLSAIAALNAQISGAQGTGQPTAALEDTRDAAIQQVATLVPVRVQQNANGTDFLSTPDGVELVGPTANAFTYNPGNNTISSSLDPNQTPLNTAFSNGQISAGLDTLDTSAAGVASQTPSKAPLEKIRDQLNTLVDQFWNQPPGAPTAFQAAYNSAGPTNAGELNTDFFTNTSFGLSPNADRFGLAVNPALLNGTSTLKQSAASPVLAQLIGTTQNFSAGGVTLANVSFNTITDTLASNQTQRAQQARTDQQGASAGLTTTQATFKNATGVNVDQELSRLIVLQNTYGASAKVISVVDQLFTQLQTLSTG